MNDGNLPKARHIGIVQIFIDIHHRFVERLALHIDGSGDVLRLASVQTTVLTAARRFFLRGLSVPNQHQVLHVGVDLHDAHVDHQVALRVRQRQYLAVLIQG